ncbi:helix-turn-helix domain-containing protein [Nonomuraea endophytica]|uniref:AraC-like DNA-binding protein n=1 Tax=Nonomuraea endophytica TaxID=714136 RepID=A0A7W8AF13_9ACTN|nr:AraC family transcriptional regulator [Nonomuraea endophytica]MBB5084945.1 AraC-like DNA-binding protein [Nonomuraea endophytica]
MSEQIAHYRTPPEGARALGLAVTGAGTIRGQDRPRTRQALTGYAGVLVTAGTGHFVLHDRPGRHRVGPGTFFWLPPGVLHTYGPSGGTWDEHWVLFEGPSTGGYENLGYLGGGVAAVEVTDPAAVAAAMTRLVELTGRAASLPDHVELGAALHTVIHAVGPGHGLSADRAPASPLGHRAIALLTADLERPVKVGEVARELSVSRDTLIAAVRAVTGDTPIDYLTRHRLDRAKVMLADTGLPVGAIARRVGYADHAYFTRVFTQRVGMSPTAFREQAPP